MKILRRYVGGQVFASTILACGALLLLFSFFDLIHELSDLGKGNYRPSLALAYVLLSVPGHLYELFPIAALLGTLFALARLVAQSEYGVMRASGVSTTAIALVLVQVGLGFAAFTFLIGEYVSPASEQAAQRMRLKTAGSSVIAQEFRSGLWVKDDSSFVNVARVMPETKIHDVRIYEFDDAYRLRTISRARSGDFQGGNLWRLNNVQLTRFTDAGTSVSQIEQADWHSVLNPAVLSVLMIVPEQLSIGDLIGYIQHLKSNHQEISRYEIALWNKLTYPFAVLVMMLLALPFANVQIRDSGVSAKIFSGIMLGLGFHLLNRLFGHIGMLNAWPPLLSATLPTVAFLSLAVVLMRRQERR
jgi:lipopolysaccharide export system permease protein